MLRRWPAISCCNERFYVQDTPGRGSAETTPDLPSSQNQHGPSCDNGTTSGVLYNVPLTTRLAPVAAALLTASLVSAQAPLTPAATRPDVTRATLTNGMRVVIIKDALAPVVTVEANFMVGGDETPAGFPGMAHAEEHMAFRRLHRHER